MCMTEFILALLVEAISDTGRLCGRGDIAFEQLRYAALLQALGARDSGLP
ncbi:MAG TPA: hypothetical protein VIU64_09070 [Polyangia bacterium]